MALIVALVVAVIAAPVAAAIATRIGLVDKPGPLKVHERPVPYLGGVAVLVAVAGPVAVSRASLLYPLALAAALGLADDRFDLPPLGRLFAQVGIGMLAGLVLPDHDVGRVMAATAVTLVLLNAVNFLDGLDGLAAGVCLASAVGFAIVLGGSFATLALALAGALAGFLVWNRPPARIYLGDAGSYLIGTALALLLMQSFDTDAAVASGALLFVGVPVADTAVAIVRRARARRSLLRGDRGHVYDQLVDRGWPVRRTVVVFVAVQAALTAAGVGIAHLSAGAAAASAAAVIGVTGLSAIAAFTSPKRWSPGRL